MKADAVAADRGDRWIAEKVEEGVDALLYLLRPDEPTVMGCRLHTLCSRLPLHPDANGIR